MSDEYNRFRKRYAPAPSQPYNAYGSATFTVSGSITDYDVKDNTTIFDGFATAGQFTVTASGANVSLKLNSTDNDALPTGNSFTMDNFHVENLYVTTPGGDANVTVTIYGWK